MNSNASTQRFMKDGRGRMVPIDLVSEIDRLRDEVVKEAIEKAIDTQMVIRESKDSIMENLKTFIDLSADRFGIKLGGKKGNITLTSFDGEYRILIAVNENIAFDERLQIAKGLIDECIKEWSDGIRSEIHILVNDAFYVDKQGKINTNRILGLRRLEINHPKWQKAMRAITESLTITGSKEYVRFYKRNGNDGYDQISLDMASV